LISVAENWWIILALGSRRRSFRRFERLPLTMEPRTGTNLAPMHPGKLLREGIFPPLGRPCSEIARLPGVWRRALDAVLSERASVTPEMALRLGQLCGNGRELWIALQTRFDLGRLSCEKAEIEAIPALLAA
jgi:antitoxin HigA-1